MSDESDIGNISRKKRKRPAHVAVTSDSSDSPLVTTSRSRKPPVSVWRQLVTVIVNKNSFFV